MKIQDNCFVYNPKCTGTVFAESPLNGKRTENRKAFLKSSIPQNLDLHIWIEIFWFAGTVYFFLWNLYPDITVLTLEKQWQNPVQSQAMAGVRQPPVVGWMEGDNRLREVLESDPCSQLILGLFWRRSCCHNHSGHSFSRARDCSLLEMGGWNCLNSHLRSLALLLQLL